MDGIAGRHPAKAGDAYFFRLNCTVGYYSAAQRQIPYSRRALLVSGHGAKRRRSINVRGCKFGAGTGTVVSNA